MTDESPPPAPAPLMQTERLSLRRMHAADAPYLLEQLNQPSFIRNIGDRKVRTLEDAQRYLRDRVIASYERHGFGMYVVELKGTGEPVGMAGLVKRDSLEDVDIGYALLERHWGQGYAIEATTAVLAHARNELGLARVVAITEPDNAGSQAVLRKLGLRFVRILELPEGKSAFFTTDS
jgi:[ribosomal protein S5]-alanine N-acetyltransferase